jgi:serine-type D-Ala-D-Ala carboxypeptidase/endopeptidase (penicillin-binding protein 4)
MVRQEGKGMTKSADRHREGYQMTVRTRGGLIAALVLVLTSVSALAQELNGRIEAMIASSKIGSASVGVSVVDLQTGRVLADIDSGTPYIPASNMKVLTAGLALSVLGDDFIFRTELLVDSVGEGGKRLIIRGSGDPALGDPAVLDRMSPKMSVEALLAAMAGSVKSAGIESISEIIVDDRIFDREYIHPTWPGDQLDRWYCAPVAGINFNTNVISFFPGPGAEGPGSPPTYSMEPEAWWLEVENRAQTSAEGANTVWFARAPGANRFTMFGQVRLPSRMPIRVTAHEVPTLIGQLVAAELPRIGVSVGPVQPRNRRESRLSRSEIEAVLATVRLASVDEVLEGRAIAAITTHIQDVLDRCNSDSQNLYAEALLKRVGHEVTREPGSWSNGASVLRMTVAELLGPEHAASMVVADGSGLSRENRVAPRTLTAWLERMQADPTHAERFIESLATPGDGTLRRRFGDTSLRAMLHAKSGSINGVRCLSGYLTDPSTGRRLAFSVMVNDLRDGDPTLQALRLHEEIVTALDRWLVAQRQSAVR